MSFWTGASINSRGPLGAVAGRKFFVGAVRYELQLFSGGRFDVRYVADVIPVAIVTGNPNADAFAFEGDTVLRIGPGPRSSVYGFGASPLGFSLTLWSIKSVALIAGGTGGFLVFTKPVPFRNARRFNYTFEFGGGVRVALPSLGSITVGYKLHHLSNAGTGRINPGLDANLIYVQITPR